MWLVVLVVAGRSPAGAQPAPTWRFSAKMDAAVSRLIVLGDGDVLAAGGLKGTATFGARTLESKDETVWLARFDATGAVKWAITLPSDKYRSQYLGALSIAKDQSILVDVLRLGEETPKLRRFTLKPDGTPKQPPTITIAEQRAIASAILPNGDSLVAVDPSKAAKPDPCKGARLQRLPTTGKPAWSTCNDKVDTGALNLIALAPDDGRSASCAYGWVASFSATGKRVWQATHPQELWCEHLALFDRGDVIATYDGPPTQTVVSWNAKGTASWTTKCTDLLSTAGNCFFSHLALDHDDVVVSARNKDKDAIIILDGKTGRANKTYPMKEFVSTFAITDTLIVFGSNTPSTTSIGVIAR